MAGAAEGGVPASPLPELLLGFCPYTVLGVSPAKENSESSATGAAAGGCSTATATSSASPASTFFASVSLKTLAQAYRRAALRAHPDKNRGREAQAAEEFVRIQAAYSFLSSEENRAAYHAFLERRERHEALLGERRRRGLQADEKKRKFAEDLKRREEAFAESQRKAQDAERGARAAADFEKDRLRRIRERNERILEEHQEKLNARYAQQQAARQAAATSLHQHSPSAQSDRNMYDAFDCKRRRFGEGNDQVHSGSANGETEDADDIEDILTRSVYVHWTAAAPGTDGEKLSGTSGPPNPASSAAGEQRETQDTAVSPTLLSSLFIPLHALYIFGYTADKGYALVAFATRERALESALEFQQQQRQRRREAGGEKKKPPRLRVKIADQVEHLRERLSVLQEAADVAAAEFARAAAEAANKRTTGGSSTSADTTRNHCVAQDVTHAPDTTSAANLQTSGVPEPVQIPLPFPSPPAVMTPASLAEFEAATLQRLKEAAAKKKAMQAAQQETGKGNEPPGVGG
ncbi:DnaJ domain-containing protein [Toxoplasma gondii ARI]|uniref:DnaJ domain-containing protein n=1 Tax=Toxoplasma gondii ARI TaxID=1074872 RepID=A0A139Y6X7_TOXGO|nr:DnaJ domain-containing protein [Toxoplasma gondii ARI]